MRNFRKGIHSGAKCLVGSLPTYLDSHLPGKISHIALIVALAVRQLQ